MGQNFRLSQPQNFGIKYRRLRQLARGNARRASPVTSGCGLLALRRPQGRTWTTALLSHCIEQFCGFHGRRSCVAGLASTSQGNERKLTGRIAWSRNVCPTTLAASEQTRVSEHWLFQFCHQTQAASTELPTQCFPLPLGLSALRAMPKHEPYQVTELYATVAALLHSFDRPVRLLPTVHPAPGRKASRVHRPRAPPALVEQVLSP